MYSRPSKRHSVSFRLFSSRTFLFSIWTLSLARCNVNQRVNEMRIDYKVKDPFTSTMIHHKSAHTERNPRPIMKIRKKKKKKKSKDEEKYKRNEIAKCSRKWVQFESFSPSLSPSAISRLAHRANSTMCVLVMAKLYTILSIVCQYESSVSFLLLSAFFSLLDSFIQTA